MTYKPIYQGEQRLAFIRESQARALGLSYGGSDEADSEGDNVGRLKTRTTSLDQAFEHPFELLVAEQTRGEEQ